ncbi:MAG: RDD family protein, partial [Mycobacteriales bacterium]
MSQIVTGEAVALDLRVARIGSRSVAAVIDMFARGVLLFALSFVFGELATVDSAAAIAIFIFLYVCVLVGYPVAFETLWRGRTPGKSAMGLRVVRDDGGPIRFRHALIRGLLGAVVELPGVTLFIAPVISSLVSERGKRLGDYAAGTIVIQERVPGRTMAAVPMPPPLAHWASTLDLSRVDNNLALGIRSFFERSNELAPQARDQLGHSLISAVLAVTSPPPPSDAPAWAVLAAVLAERRRRDEMRLQQQRQMVARASAAPGAPAWQGQPAAHSGW